MSETKEFPTAEVLSASVGILMCEMGKVYEVLNWMTGESLFTHQLPRVGREACDALLKIHGEAFATTLSERDSVNTGNWKEWRDKWIARHGPTMAVPKMTADQHESIDPLSEAAQRIPPDRLIVIGVKK